MCNEEKLFKACRLLFGEEVLVSQAFLDYLEEEGIGAAFRKKALDLHPDRIAVSGLPMAKAQAAFRQLQDACTTLREYVRNRKNRFKHVTITAKNLPEQQLLFGRFLYHTGIIELQQIAQALAWQKLSGVRIGELAVKMGYLEEDAVPVILNYCQEGVLFGMTAWELGLLTENDIQTLLSLQKNQKKKIGQFFVEQGIISEPELNTLLRMWKQHNRKIESIAARNRRMGNDERRKNVRVTFRTTADLHFSDTSFQDRAIADLSLHGVYVDGIPGRTVGEVCDITLKLTGSAAHPSLSMKAEVIRVTKQGVGLHFTSIDLDCFAHLRQIIRHNRDDAEVDEIV